MQRKGIVVIALVIALAACITFIALNRSWITGQPEVGISSSENADASDINRQASGEANTAASVSTSTATGGVEVSAGAAVQPDASHEKAADNSSGNEGTGKIKFEDLSDNTQRDSSQKQDHTNSAQVETDSEAVKTLKTLYGYLENEADYNKGMRLLDSKFVIELDLMKQFGINSLTKADIDLEQASVYSDLLKAARLVNIVDEVKSGDKSVVYYYQEICTEENQLKQALKAELTYNEGSWSILSISECSPDTKPFTN